MDTPDEQPSLRNIVEKFGLRAKRNLGQHFLLDKNINNKIAGVACELIENVREATIVEIGAGPGGLTRSILAKKPKNLFAVELDQRCVKALNELNKGYKETMHVISADALQMDITNLGSAPRYIIANLPYNISIPLLLHWLKQLDNINHMTLMFQKEVVDRLMALPNTKDYGRLSVITQWLCEIKFHFHISQNAFTPPPKVKSSLITLTPKSNIGYEAKFSSMEKATATAFGQRRKMLRSSLKALNLDIEGLNINPEARAEDLSVREFCKIANAIDKKI